MSSVRAPFLAEATAAGTPPGPPPTTMTSSVLPRRAERFAGLPAMPENTSPDNAFLHETASSGVCCLSNRCFLHSHDRMMELSASIVITNTTVHRPALSAVKASCMRSLSEHTKHNSGPSVRYPHEGQSPPDSCVSSPSSEAPFINACRCFSAPDTNAAVVPGEVSSIMPMIHG